MSCRLLLGYTCQVGSFLFTNVAPLDAAPHFFTHQRGLSFGVSLVLSTTKIPPLPSGYTQRQNLIKIITVKFLSWPWTKLLMLYDFVIA